jgi:hypothetical protein
MATASPVHLLDDPTLRDLAAGRLTLPFSRH